MPMYMVFNNKHMKQFALPLPYETVLSGDWTVEVFELSSTDDPGKTVFGFEKAEKRPAVKAADFFSVFFEQ